jgi:hypothetical protein
MTYEETLRMFLDNLNEQWDKGPYLFPQRFNMYVKEHQHLADGFGRGVIQIEIRNKQGELVVLQVVRPKSEEFGTEMWAIYKEEQMRKIVNTLLGYGLLECERELKRIKNEA